MTDNEEELETLKPSDSYLMVQPFAVWKYAVQLGKLSESFPPEPKEATPEEVYDTLEEAIRDNAERARATDVGFQVFTQPIDLVLKYDADTLSKVYSALMRLKLGRDLSIEIVNAIQNEGILFRERA